MRYFSLDYLQNNSKDINTHIQFLSFILHTCELYNLQLRTELQTEIQPGL